MDNQKFTSGWLKFFILHDHVSKILMALAVAGLTFCIVDKFQHPVIAMSMAALLVISVAMSFFTYLIVGKYREACVSKFYDAVRYAGDLPMEYQGRDLKRIKIDWKWRRVRSLKFSVSTNSPAVQSDHEWRTVQRAARESFQFEHKHMLTFLEKHSAGVFVFRSATDEELASNSNAAVAVVKESMYAFAYETLSSTGHTLPLITRFDVEGNDAGRLSLHTVEIRFDQQVSEYDMQRFESAYNRKFRNVDAQWVFEWAANSVIIRAIAKGSEEEQQVNALHSLERLVEASVSTGFTLYDKSEYLFDADSFVWSQSEMMVSQLSIDFLRSDVSRPENVAEFESLMTQGLKQMFPNTFWEFVWDVNAYKRAVFVRRVSDERIAAASSVKITEDIVVDDSPLEAPLSKPVKPAERKVQPFKAPVRAIPTPQPAPVKRVIPARPTLKNLPPRPPKLDV